MTALDIFQHDAETEMTPHLLEQAGVVSDGDQYPQSTPSSDVALLDSLPKAHQEIAVTMMLDQGRQWLVRALEATNPAREVSDFKAFVATVAEAAKQKKLSEGIQLDAVEMVRRSERALGVAIRKGQDAGEIADRAVGSAVRDQRLDATLVSPTQFFSHAQEKTDAYAMTDDVTDEQFDAALAEAKEEGNLSRSNVVKKVKQTKEATKQAGERTEYHQMLADLHPTLRIAFEMDAHEQYSSLAGFESAARRAGVSWKFTERQWQSRVETSRDVLNRSSLGIEVALDAIDLRVDMTTITPEQATEVLERLNASALNRIIKQLKEISNG